MKNILWILIFCMGCASKPIITISPPNLEEIQDAKTNISNPDYEVSDLSSAKGLYYRYLSANKLEESKDYLTACRKYTDLSEINISPIRDLATLKVLSLCELSDKELIKIWKSFTPQSFILESYIEKSLNMAKKRNLKPFISKFSIDLFPFKKIKSEKIKLLNEAKTIEFELEHIDKGMVIEKLLMEISPKLTTEITLKNIFFVAKDFETARDFSKARALYYEIIYNNQQPIELKVKAYNALRMSYKVERNLSTFLDKTYEMVEFLNKEVNNNPNNKKIPSFWVEAKINLARAVWTENNPTEAKRILKEILESNLGNDNQLANVHLILGSISLEKKKNKEALEYLKTSSSFKITDLSLSENIQWSLIWNLYLLKKYSDVVTYSTSFIKPSLNPNFYLKLYYWKGKALQNLHESDEAVKTFENIIASDPFGYYGILATLELNQKLLPLKSESSSFVFSGDQNLDWLMILGELDFGQQRLKEIDSKFKTINDREKAMNFYRQTHWYAGASRQLTNLPLKNRPQISINFYDVLFPTPNMELVQNFSKKYKVPSEYILAITRQESNFVAHERSWADAFGLMQMIPEKAKVLSSKYNIPYQAVEDLYLPNINIEMGTALLSELLKSYKFKFVQSTAAYNASSTAIAKWEKDRFHGNYIEFIEQIPYEETRNYIKLVFRNYIAYKRILSDNPIELDSNFFAHSFLNPEAL